MSFSPQEMPTPMRPLVLVVEDSPMMRQVAAINLDKFMLDVDYAANGREAVDLFAKRHYSLVLMDVRMPEMDGLDATREMRKLERRTGRHTPILAITASDTKEHCLRAGMDDYLTKPCDYPRLIQKWLPDVGLKSA